MLSVTRTEKRTLFILYSFIPTLYTCSLAYSYNLLDISYSYSEFYILKFFNYLNY